MSQRSQRTGANRTARAAGHDGWRPRWAMGMPVQKAKNFRGTLFRLLGYFRPQRSQLVAVLVAAILEHHLQHRRPEDSGTGHHQALRRVSSLKMPACTRSQPSISATSATSC